MNFEALAVIGGFALILGAVLYFPFFLWKKWSEKQAWPSRGRLASRITRQGITLYGAMVAMLFVGYAQEHLAPQTEFGSFMSTWWGRLTYAAILIALMVVVEVALTFAGVKLHENRSKDV